MEGRGGGLWPAHSLALPGAHPLRAPHGEGPNRCVLTEVTAGGWRRPADKKSCPGWVPALHAGQVSSCRLTCSDWDGMLENQAQGLPSLQTGVRRVEGSEGSPGLPQLVPWLPVPAKDPPSLPAPTRQEGPAGRPGHCSEPGGLSEVDSGSSSPRAPHSPSLGFGGVRADRCRHQAFQVQLLSLSLSGRRTRLPP